MENNLFAPGEISDLKAIALRYSEPASAIMPLLHYVQRSKGYLKEEYLVFVAEMLDIPHVRTFEVATYYTMFFTEPVGKHLIQVCRNLSCSLSGSREVLSALVEHIGAEVGQTSPDGMFTLVEVECIGACDKAPAVMIDDDLFEFVAPENVKDIVASFREAD